METLQPILPAESCGIFSLDRMTRNTSSQQQHQIVSWINNFDKLLVQHCNREHLDERKRWSAHLWQLCARQRPMLNFFNCRIKKSIGIRCENNNVLPILPDLLSCNSLTATRSCESLFQLCSHQLSNQTFNRFFKMPIKISREDGCLYLKNKSFECEGQN